MGLSIQMINLAPVRHNVYRNCRATATYQIGANCPGARFAIWRTPNGDIVSGAPEADLGQPETVKAVGPLNLFSAPIMERVAADFLARYRAEFPQDTVEAAPFVPFGDPCNWPENNTGWGRGKSRPSQTGVGLTQGLDGGGVSDVAQALAEQPKGATAQPASDAPAQAKSASGGPSLKQKEYLHTLGYTGPMPESVTAASQLIKQKQNEKAERDAREKAAQPAMGI